MDKVVDSIEGAYKDFVKGIAELLEARQNNGGENSTAAAVESFANKWESLKVACDNAESFVNAAKQSIACKSGVDVASYERSVQDLPVEENVDVYEGGVILEDDETVNDEVLMKDSDVIDDRDNKEEVGKDDDDKKEKVEEENDEEKEKVEEENGAVKVIGDDQI